MNRPRVPDVASVLRRRIQWGTHLGLVKTGDRLPSLRAAANEFGVDQRSVLAAYRALEAEGLVVMRPRSGIYVAGERVPVQVAPAARWMSEMFLQGFARGVPPVSLGATLATAAATTTLTAACLECNADQILWLAAHLRYEFGLSTTWIESQSADRDTITERLRSADFIVTTAFHAPEARQFSEQFGIPVVVATASGDQVSQLRAELSRGPVYFVGTDERYARKLLEGTDSARWMANLRPLVLDRTVPQTIPSKSPLVITKAVAEILGEKSLPKHAMILDFPFSTETRSEILALMLAAYLENAKKSGDPGVPELR